MKKRVLSLFMALMLCLTLLPTAALAEETEGTAQTPPAVEKAADPANGEEQQENQPAAPKQENQSAEQEEQQEDSAAKQAVATVQAMIGELPSLGELKGMDSDTLNEAYMAVQSAYDAYEALTAEQQAQITGAERFEDLFNWFNGQIALLDGDVTIYPDDVNANGDIIPYTDFSRTGPLLTGTETTLSGKYYIVQGDITISGDLTVDGSKEGGLVLCQGAKLTINGALIHTGGKQFYIYGQSNNGADTGELIINNSNGDGAAIRTASTYDARLGINSGKVTVISGISKELIGDHITLYSTKPIHEGILDGDAKLPSEWGKSSISGGNLVLEYCGHDHAAYTPSGSTQHIKSCAQCGFNTGSSPKIADCGSDGYERTVSAGVEGHRRECPCGNLFGDVIEHMIETVPTYSKQNHITGCRECDYTEGAPQDHDWDRTTGECTGCGFKPIALDKWECSYDSLQEAMNEASKIPDGPLVTLYSEASGKAIDDGFVFNYPDKTITLNMNGYTLENEGAPVITVEAGTLKITGAATINQTGTFSDLAAPAVKVTGGTLIFDGKLTATGASGKPAVEVTNGTLRLKEGDVLNGGVSVEGSTTYANVNALLGDGLAFAKEDEHSIIVVKGNVKSIDENVVVKEHGHSFTLDSDGKYTCVCGYTCPHDKFENGVCKICGNGCAHTNVDENGLCRNCKTQMAVKITASDNTVTYGTDFKSAMRNATNGTKITLLADVSIVNRTGISGDDTTVTLDLNGHKITSGYLDVGDKDTNGTYTTCTLKIIGNGSYEPPMYGGIIAVNMKATLDLSEWEGGTISSINISDNSNYEAATREAAVIVGPKAGTIGNLSFGNNQLDELKKTKLSGGSFNEIWAAGFGQPVKLGELLAEGYAYQYTDGGDRFVEYTKTLQGASIYNVKVVKCPHAKINEDGHCAYCNATGFVAQVTAADGSSSAYTDIAAAIAAAGGGTVKLLANASEITINSPLKLDLNGKTAAKLTVTGDVTLASLLPEGYAFKSGSTWITDLNSTELTNVSMAKIPIKSMEYPTEMSMDYGGTGTLIVNVRGTGAVRFQWYKVEDGKATEVGSATAKNQFDLSALKLSAGNHTFRFSATCDGYKKMSQDIVVTVQKANIGSNRIMPPTAQENLTYTGQPQALITAGSVTSGGTMQYSLTENGTYSQDSPTGTDAGAYTVWYRVIGDANHKDTTPASVAVRIGQKPLTITGVTAASKPYDGTTNADISSVTFDNVTLNRGTDYTVTANFDDAGVDSGKNVTATVTLMGQAAKNYALEQSSFPTTGSIIKAAAPDFTKETALTIVNGHEKTYTVTLPALPTLETPKAYGALTYEIGEIKLNDGYYTSGAKVENGELTLPIQKNDVKTTGSVGTATVVIKSTNYEDITLTVNVSAKNKLSPVLAGTLTLTPIKITYGEPLSKIKITGTMKAGDTVVEGTFSWQLPGNTILDASTSGHTVEWTFTPKDGNTYTEVTGTATVQVGKATQYGKVSMAGYTYGQTPSTPTLTNRTGDANAQVTYRYSAAGSGSVQTWDIQNPPALNAGTYRMYASIGDTDNYYGCEAVYCEFVVAKATPTYTAPTGLTAKYGQTLADVKLSNPEGNLDGTWSWMNSSESVGDASTVTKTFQAKFTPKDTENYNTVENIELEVMVNKADGRNLKTVELEQKYTDASDHTYTPDWAGLPAGQDWTFSSEASIVLPKQDFAADGSLLTYAISGGKAGDKITITLKASCDNYEDFTIALTITLTEKDNQQALRITGGATVVYGQTLQLGTSGGSGAGAVTYAVTNGTGEATIDAATGKLTPVKVGTVKVKATKAADASFNEATSAEVEITITRATPTGEPAYTKITASGKTLADAGLGIGTITPAGGTIAWDDPTTTEVVANKSYGWTYTPADTNYDKLTGTIKLWSKSSGGGSGRTAAVVAPDMPMLYRGYTGDAVKTLQEKLNAKGFDSGNVDGIFGAKTYAAVTAFQKANGLGVDGIVGKLTWAKLYDATPVNVTPVTTQPMLRTGSRGDAVRKLQEMLNAKGYTCGNVDGIFGSKTYAAVLAFQKANGLGADGIVGPLTWGKLV